MRGAASLAAASLLFAGCGGGGGTVSGPPPKAPSKIVLNSPAFGDGQTLPKPLTCDGQGSSPALRWYRVPRRTRELALLVEDPDAPGGTFVHWSVWGISPNAGGLETGQTASLQQGENGFGDVGYGAPCPPRGDAPHRYVFSLYALSDPLPVGNGASAAEVRGAIGEGAIAKGTLTARYGR
jgi:Raf kinase inhibitor-like YbhB/YbcL family protein